MTFAQAAYKLHPVILAFTILAVYEAGAKRCYQTDYQTRTYFTLESRRFQTIAFNKPGKLNKWLIPAPFL